VSDERPLPTTYQQLSPYVDTFTCPEEFADACREIDKRLAVRASTGAAAEPTDAEVLAAAQHVCLIGDTYFEWKDRTPEGEEWALDFARRMLRDVRAQSGAAAEPTEWDKLRALKPGWDSYGAPPISPDAIASARAWLAGVQIVPTSHGGVQLEWHRHGVEVEVEFSADGKDVNVFTEPSPASASGEGAPDRPGGEWGLLYDVARLREVAAAANLTVGQQADLHYSARRLTQIEKTIRAEMSTLVSRVAPPAEGGPTDNDLTLAATVLVRLINRHPLPCSPDDVRALAARLRASTGAAEITVGDLRRALAGTPTEPGGAT
jgi:hypothetical protein